MSFNIRADPQHDHHEDNGDGVDPAGERLFTEPGFQIVVGRLRFHKGVQRAVEAHLAVLHHLDAGEVGKRAGRRGGLSGLAQGVPHAEREQEEHRVDREQAPSVGQDAPVGDEQALKPERVRDALLDAAVNPRHEQGQDDGPVEEALECEAHGAVDVFGNGLLFAQRVVAEEETRPARPEQHGQRAAEGDEHHQHGHEGRSRGGRLDGDPLGEQRAEGRQHHGHDAEQGDGGDAGHDPVQAAHGFDVARADVLFDGAHAEEEEPLRHGVEDDEQDGGGDRRGGRHPGARDDQAEVGDGGVGEDLLAVALSAGQRGGGHEGERAAQRHDARQHGPGEGRSEAQDEVDPGLDHRGRVQQGGNGRGRDHRAAQPALEGQLRRLGEGGEAEEGDRQHGGGGVHDHGLRQHGLNGQGADGLLHEQHGGEEADAAHHVHPQGAGGVALGLAGSVMADEEEGAQRRDFPEEEHPREAVAQHETVHGAEEQQQEEEKAGLAGFGEAKVVFVLLHVAETENTDHSAHE